MQLVPLRIGCILDIPAVVMGTTVLAAVGLCTLNQVDP
jgi:hypothetical protein